MKFLLRKRLHKVCIAQDEVGVCAHDRAHRLQLLRVYLWICAATVVEEMYFIGLRLGL